MKAAGDHAENETLAWRGGSIEGAAVGRDGQEGETGETGEGDVERGLGRLRNEDFFTDFVLFFDGPVTGDIRQNKAAYRKVPGWRKKIFK